MDSICPCKQWPMVFAVSREQPVLHTGDQLGQFRLRDMLHEIREQDEALLMQLPQRAQGGDAAAAAAVAPCTSALGRSAVTEAVQ